MQLHHKPRKRPGQDRPVLLDPPQGENIGAEVYYLRPFVLAIVEYFEPITFAALIKRLAPLQCVVELAGQQSIAGPGGVVLWGGMSAALTEAVRQLLNGGVVFPHPARVSDYVRDGEVPDLPIATKPMTGYSDNDPHWLPAMLRTVPFE
jgi:hypothetical protein